MRIVMAACLLTACALLSTPPTLAQRASRPTLSATDIDNIATLLKLEDTRQFDEATLTRLVASAHPEVKRRAIMSVGRIVNDQGRAILASLHGETDPELLATVAFATGQLKDADAIAWLGALLSNPRAASAVRREAAQALGKMAPAAATPPQPLTPPGRAAHDALAGFLAAAPMSSPAVVVGEALLSIGRFPTMEDPAPIVRWTTSRDVEVRWRAAWALFRPRNPAATPALLTLTADAAAEVRFWAVRGLTAAVVSQSSVPLATASARLRQALNDPDRRVRTEAVRALVAFDAALPSARYDDDASFDAAVKALQSSDTWMSISAIESLQRFPSRAVGITPLLVAATGARQPLALRIAGLAPLAALDEGAARALAAELAQSPNTTARDEAARIARQLDAAAARAAQAASGQPAAGAGRQGGGAAGRGGPTRPALVARADAEYRALVTQWIVPDYNGAPRPHVVLTTPRGQIDVELYPGDAPFGVEYLMQVVESGEIVNTEFGRVVPNFVAQQRAIRNAGTLRDEVNRHGLTRGNLSWASSGLDTGRPGYTLGNTPQPHNEGNFTSLGRVVKGIEAVDRLQLGDKITAAKVVQGQRAEGKGQRRGKK